MKTPATTTNLAAEPVRAQPKKGAKQSAKKTSKAKVAKTSTKKSAATKSVAAKKSTAMSPEARFERMRADWRKDVYGAANSLLAKDEKLIVTIPLVRKKLNEQGKKEITDRQIRRAMRLGHLRYGLFGKKAEGQYVAAAK